MKRLGNLFLTTILLIVSSCETESKLPSDPLMSFSEIMELKTVSQDELSEIGLFSVYQFIVRDSVLITRNSQTDYGISVYNFNNQRKKDFVRKGRGPGEALSLMNMAETAGGLVGLDGNNKRIADVEIIGDSVRYDFIDLPEDDIYTSLIKGDDFVVLTGMMEKGRYLYYDLESKESTIYCSYPVGKEYRNSPDFVKNRIMISSVMAMKPDQSRFVCIHYNSGVVDICRIENGGIVRHKLLDFYYPKVRIRNNNDDYPTVAITRDHPNGFFSVQTDDQYIYALYSGKTYEDHGTQFGYCDYLLVFDWDGNPVKAYHLEMPLTTIYWNRSEQILYGLSIDEEEHLVRFTL